MPQEKCLVDPSRDCLGLAKAEMLEKQMDEYRRQSRETHSELYNRITELEKSDAKRNEQYNTILDKLNDMQLDISKALLSISEFKEKPGKRWDKIVDKILLLVITACVGYILLNSDCHCEGGITVKINWKVRLKNKAFWIALIPALFLLVTQVCKVFGLSLDLSTLQEQVLGIVGTVFTLLALFGVVNDPTTSGASDSEQALTYSEPKKSE